MTEFLAAAWFSFVSLCILFLLAMALYNLVLVVRYRRLRGPDPAPTHRFADAELPYVTVQLPTYNEGELARQSLCYAAGLDYPRDRLEVQFLDDSDDETTSAIALAEIERLRRQEPGLDISYHHRTSRSNFKAGALKLGTERAKGRFFAIFDADFEIPRGFLRRTIHYFADPNIGIVQARWAYSNRDTWIFTQLQANKLDAHQMFEQTARGRSGLPVIFHGTAGIWRAEALDAAGGWNCISEVEDVELTVRATMKGWRAVYLDHLRLNSELPETVHGYVRQQMRWKRGWTRISLRYSGQVLGGPIAWGEKLDLLQRINLSWGPMAGFVMTLGVLPYFIAAERLGLVWPGSLLYVAMLVVSLVTRNFETRTLREDPAERGDPAIPPLFRFIPFSYLIMGLGMTWPLTQATLEGLGKGGQTWEVTPKRGSTPTAAAASSGGLLRLPSYVIGTLVVAALSLGLSGLSLVMGHYLATLFYTMLAVGSGWTGWHLLRHQIRPPGHGTGSGSSGAQTASS